MKEYTLFGTNWYDLPLDLIVLFGMIYLWFRWIDKLNT